VLQSRSIMVQRSAVCDCVS